MSDSDATKEQPVVEEAPKKEEVTNTGEEEAPKTPNIEEILPFGTWLNSGKTWGTSFVQSAKEKTLSTLEMVKKDLNEFSDTVSQEATAIASATTDAVKQQAQLFHQFVTTPDGEDEPEEKKPEEKAKEATTSGVPNSTSGFGFGWINSSLKTVVDTVQKFAVEDTTKDEDLYTEKIHLGPIHTTKDEDLYTEKIHLGPIRQSILDHYELSQIQNDKKTFLTEPDNKERYSEWLKTFKIAEYNGEINTLLGNNPRLRELYASVVPAEVDNFTFWSRYFFKVHQKEEDKKGKEQQSLEINVNCPKSKKSTPEGSDVNDKDETWSMCSSTHEHLNEIPDEVSDVEQTGPMTPKAKDEPAPDDEVSDVEQTGPMTPKAKDEPAPDGWEKFDVETNKESTA
uniref:BSD domain-containing protein n=1 Tax=Panagrolaimus sp. JU765 TaxID=591449 RepID=A0AC34QUJ3_9BILA